MISWLEKNDTAAKLLRRISRQAHFSMGAATAIQLREVADLLEPFEATVRIELCGVPVTDIPIVVDIENRQVKVDNPTA